MSKAKAKKKHKANGQRTASIKVGRHPLADLRPHPDNPRVHPDPGSAEWDAVRRSLESDYFDPLVWNKRNGMLVSGHLRRRVLEELGFGAADVVVVDYDEPTHRARVVTANRLAGEDDEAALAALLRPLSEEARSLTGMTEADIAALLNGMSAPGEFPEVGEGLEVDHICPKCGYAFSGGKVRSNGG